MNLVYILGDGPHSYEIAELLSSLGFQNFVRLAQEDESRIEKGDCLVLGVGNAVSRSRILRTFRHNEILTLFHPKCEVSSSSIVGQGSVLSFGSIVSANSSIGSGVLVNWHASIGHDVTIGAASVIGPGVRISGWCKLGDSVELGANSVVLPRVSLASGTRVGAGAVVTRSFMEPNITLVGVPARPLVR